MQFSQFTELFVRQRRELAEFFGFETRNKYEIFDANQRVMAFAAEKRLGILDFLVRQFLGHWRSFELQFFSPQRELLFKARHPFRFFFARLEVTGADGNALGLLQQRFSILHKSFDVQDSFGRVVMEVRSPLWRPWTFVFSHGGRERALVAKKWSGLLSEIFTDRDNFAVRFSDPALSEPERRLVLAAALFIDLQYFEKKASD